MAQRRRRKHCCPFRYRHQPDVEKNRELARRLVANFIDMPKEKHRSIVISWHLESHGTLADTAVKLTTDK